MGRCLLRERKPYCTKVEVQQWFKTISVSLELEKDEERQESCLRHFLLPNHTDLLMVRALSVSSPESTILSVVEVDNELSKAVGNLSAVTEIEYVRKRDCLFLKNGLLFLGTYFHL
ncbi:unnamed protein product [Lepeophtheirus salmonis]|uniref:(salmon louse) hypothetical protein n=1 Tax=Lepeophtheirus salmonis TaxID=72036 RepID=A0A817FCF0_LEPSM|nr:unnamed protein product [Lepeophtheirus salmonis]CAG9477497.1 unnamed protein product [Lepeophtheirus salmonis]